MSEVFFEQPGLDADDGFQEPDLGPLRVLAEKAELADAVGGLTDGYGWWLAVGDPLRPLACAVARGLTEAGFTLHHCSPHHPLYRLGGVCLLPVDHVNDEDRRGGVVVSWTTHHLLSRDWERWDEYHGTQEVMNTALGDVLGVLGFEVRPFGVGGAWIVTARAGGQEPGE